MITRLNKTTVRCIYIIFVTVGCIKLLSESTLYYNRVYAGNCFHYDVVSLCTYPLIYTVKCLDMPLSKHHTYSYVLKLQSVNDTLFCLSWDFQAPIPKCTSQLTRINDLYGSCVQLNFYFLFTFSYLEIKFHPTIFVQRDME